MHITLIAGGKLKDPSLKALFEEYKKRLDWKLTLHECEGKDLSALLANHPSFIITLDEQGDSLKSEAFSVLLNDIQLHHQGKVTFVIGGADGLSQDIKAKAHKSLAFGHMTWPHLMARIMLMEQLYRAQQILKGHPYHRE
jgi:23S rRNA (pseudouridine1915-N3)-methyltransferase